jgi:hypothetical protein
VEASGELDQWSTGDLIVPSRDDLFSSGTLGRYCSALGDIVESHLLFPYEEEHGKEELIPKPTQWNDP